MPAELFQLANSPSTIYNILSNKEKEGEVLRKARGVYVLAGAAAQVTVADIAEKKAARHDKVIKAKAISVKDDSTTDKHEFWTNGRSTSFRVFVDGQPADTVIFKERGRPTDSSRSHSMPPSKPPKKHSLLNRKILVNSAGLENIESQSQGCESFAQRCANGRKQPYDSTDSPPFKLSSINIRSEFILHPLLEFCRKLFLEIRHIAEFGLRRVALTFDSLTLVMDFEPVTNVSKPP